MPALAWAFGSYGFPAESVMHMAIATSLATIIATSLASIKAHHKRGAIEWPTVLYLLAPGIILGSVAGAYVAEYFSSNLLKQIFALFLIIIACQLFFQLRPESKKRTLSDGAKRVGGGVIGLLSALLGIGGGSMTVPLLIYSNYEPKNAVAISSACGLPIAVFGSLTYLLTGLDEQQLPKWSVGYIYLPAVTGIIASSILTAPLGAKLAHQLPAEKLKRAFAILLAIIGLNLLL